MQVMKINYKSSKQCDNAGFALTQEEEVFIVTRIFKSETYLILAGIWKKVQKSFSTSKRSSIQIVMLY